MTQINLLPWREQERQNKKMRFVYTIISFVVLTLVFVVILHFYYDHLISLQEARNTYLQSVLDVEGGELVSLNKKKKEQALINAKLHFIITLQQRSYHAVQILNELVRLVPEGISLIKIAREGNNILLIGRAQSDVQITQLLKNMAKSKIFKQPVLTEISSKEGTATGDRYFQLTVEQQ